MGIFDRFKKNHDSDQSGEISEIGESWNVLRGENEGKPMFVRKNMACDKMAGNKYYSVNCGIAFKILYPNSEGLPDFEKEPELNDIEDDIFEIFESDLNSIVPLIITTSGFREFVFYTRDLPEFLSRLEKLKSRYPQYELTSFNKQDPNWITYSSFG